jgi:hypothetical protein
LAVGGWRSAVGGWRLAVGGWRVAVGGWRGLIRGVMSRAEPQSGGNLRAGAWRGKGWRTLPACDFGKASFPGARSATNLSLSSGPKRNRRPAIRPMPWSTILVPAFRATQFRSGRQGFSGGCPGNSHIRKARMYGTRPPKQITKMNGKGNSVFQSSRTNGGNQQPHPPGIGGAEVFISHLTPPRETEYPSVVEGVL